MAVFESGSSSEEVIPLRHSFASMFFVIPTTAASDSCWLHSTDHDEARFARPLERFGDERDGG